MYFSSERRDSFTYSYHHLEMTIIDNTIIPIPAQSDTHGAGFSTSQDDLGKILISHGLA
jgi:hypothetical protein